MQCFNTSYFGKNPIARSKLSEAEYRPQHKRGNFSATTLKTSSIVLHRRPWSVASANQRAYDSPTHSEPSDFVVCIDSKSKHAFRLGFLDAGIE